MEMPASTFLNSPLTQQTGRSPPLRTANTFHPGDRLPHPNSETLAAFPRPVLLQRGRSTPPVEATRLAGEYGLPIAAPELVGDRPEIDLSPSFGFRRQVSHPGDFRHAPSPDPESRVPSEPSIPEGVVLQEEDNVPWYGSWRKLCLIVVFIGVESAKHLLSASALDGKKLTPAQLFIVMQELASLVAATMVTLFLEGISGPSGLARAWSLDEIVRCIPVSIGFALSTSALAFAYSGGTQAATIVVMGYFYMPMGAFLSRYFFGRKYGWLEVHALAFLTISAMLFMEQDFNRASEGKHQVHKIDAILWCIISSIFAVWSSIFAERVMKAKYSPELEQPFHVQKVWIEAGGFVTSTIMLCVLGIIEDAPGIPEIVSSWDKWMVLALIARVLQSWMAGVVAKHLSTVAKAVIQCTALLCIYSGEIIDGARGLHLTNVLLTIIVALSAVMYQMGRRMTTKERDSERRLQGPPEESLATIAGGPPDPARDITVQRDFGAVDNLRESFLHNETALFPDGTFLAPREFRVHEEGSREPLQGGSSTGSPNHHIMTMALWDRTWMDQARRYNDRLATWATSWVGMSSQVLCLVTFIASDASRTLIYAWAIPENGPIVPQSLVFSMSAVSVPIGILMSAVFDGKTGFLDSLSVRDMIKCLPVTAFFSLGATLQVTAYSFGISASVNTVLGYFYMPLSAMLSRVVFKRYYGSLEYLALVLLSIAAVVFCLLKDSQGHTSTSLVAVCCCLGSVVTSCVASVLCEKILKQQVAMPFYTQKVHLESGGTVTAGLVFFLVGYLTSLAQKPGDPPNAAAFWVERPVDGKMEAGAFVGWDYKTYLALIASLVQSWLGGLVSKRLSTVVKSVAQCITLLIIYFFGDLVLYKKPFDWVVGAAAIIVALSVQVFTLAGKRIPRVPVPQTPPEMVEGEANPEIVATGQGCNPELTPEVAAKVANGL